MNVGGFAVDAVVFDLDGTLLDSERAITGAAAAAFADVGVNVTPLAVADHLGAPLEELYAVFVHDGDAVRLRAFVAAYLAHHDSHPDRFPPPLPGVREALIALRKHELLLAVATTKPSARAREQLAGCELDMLFGHIQGTDVGMKAKPAPDVVLAACAGLGVAPSRALMVGDTPRDVLAGRSAGCATAVVAYGAERLHAARGFGADCVVDDLRALLAPPAVG